MYKHFLIPTDGSPQSEVAIQQGIALARATHARLTGLTVFPTFETARSAGPPGTVATHVDYEARCDARAALRLESVERRAAEAGIPHDLVHVFDDLPYVAILRTAQERGCDLIVIGSPHREGLSALVLGSETTRVLAYSKIPVLVCR